MSATENAPESVLVCTACGSHTARPVLPLGITPFNVRSFFPLGTIGALCSVYGTILIYPLVHMQQKSIYLLMHMQPSEYDSHAYGAEVNARPKLHSADVPLRRSVTFSRHGFFYTSVDL